MTYRDAQKHFENFEDMGWNDDCKLQLAVRFIEEKGYGEEFQGFLTECAVDYSGEEE